MGWDGVGWGGMGWEECGRVDDLVVADLLLFCSWGCFGTGHPDTDQ